ncbi:MAG: heavy metal transporter [Azospira oryzae]|jgi:hypothetical protein|nr:MAG: heavy metal transporter [Azospira oryzae]
MAKIIRPTYPKELSIGLLLLIFAVSFFLSGQIFETAYQANAGKNLYVGMFLFSSAVIIMMLVLWEEFLFPIKVKPNEDGMVFRNHRNKLLKQALIYCAIPAIFAFLYIEYKVSVVYFSIWAAVCIILPVAGKLISGIKNYNDFLKLTNDTIEYKNNHLEGVYALKDIQRITLIKDERTVLHKIQLLTVKNEQITIDLDEMELEAYYAFIDKFITGHYKSLLKPNTES